MFGKVGWVTSFWREKLKKIKKRVENETFCFFHSVLQFFGLCLTKIFDVPLRIKSVTVFLETKNSGKWNIVV